ncbi:MAG: transporter related [Verrucomicrobiaceae bacterium]|nr:transporter related [Verrucomicrobiaceae bacterium]
MSSSAVHMRDVQTTLGSGVRLSLPEFKVEQGQALAITGPSGCGKSTLLNLISGLRRPDRGMVSVLGTDVARLKAAETDRFRGANLGFIHQSFHLLEAFTAMENVLLGLRFGGAVPSKQWKTKAHELLTRVGLGHRLDARPASMSVGERQRVAIARALANNPKLLLADEPTGALDPKTAEDVFALLLEVAREHGCALLLVTHDHALAARLPATYDASHLIIQGGRA